MLDSRWTRSFKLYDVDDSRADGRAFSVPAIEARDLKRGR